MDNINTINESLASLDLPFARNILESVMVNINSTIEAGENKFILELQPFYTEEMTNIQKSRILDMVIFNIRNAGINCLLSGDNEPTEFIRVNNYNLSSLNHKYLHVGWNIKKDREYLKTYC